MSENQPSLLGNTTNALGNIYSSASDGLNSLKNTASDGLNSLKNTASDGLNTIKTTASSMTDYSSSKSLGEASSEFMQSNSIIAKLAFLFFVIIIFNILLRLGMFLLSYFSVDNENPYLIEGLISCSTAILIPQNPKNKNAVTLLRSNNKASGLEFTWSVWLYINDLGTVTPDNSSAPTYSHIFHKGSRDYANNISTITNGPGVYLSSNTNPTIRIIMDTVDSSSRADITVDNIPLRKWFNLIIRMQNTSMDIYINGVVTQHKLLEAIPKQNYYDVYVCDKGGFNGNLSNLRYYSSALNIFDINGVVKKGPNLKPSTSPAVTQTIGAVPPNYSYSYLSTNWYTSRS